MEQRKKTTLLTLKKLKDQNKKAVYLTAYDYPIALLADRAGVDMILVGDSLGMTTLGYKDTLKVTMDDMVRHASAVTRAAASSFIIGDMPFMSYQTSDRDAIINAGRLISEAGCDAVKCEGGVRVVSRVKAMVDAGILVQGHLGLTPQNAAQMGGYRVQGKTRESYQQLLQDALALEEAGVFSLLLEGMPSQVAEKIKNHLSIPVYGIGAGNKVDGQLLIVHDLIGLFEQFTPKFVKRYAETGKVIEEAIGRYCDDVRKEKFPTKKYFYEISKEELKKLDK
jgi:3-methyl-2-oxobutanoate hydroxymethyltransferase